MKTSELRKIIKEEISKVSNEDVRPSQLYGRTMDSHKQLKNELEKLFRPGTINKLNNTQILDIVKDINRITRIVNNLRK
jgi:CRISPR/Cas system CSM-associated protein Csm2 small subunit